MGALADELALPGRTYLLDFPGDGSNVLDNRTPLSWHLWEQGLVHITQQFSPCVLVAHSFGGMVAQSIPTLENTLAGLVLLNSTPNREFVKTRPLIQKQFNLPDLTDITEKYQKNPTQENFVAYLQIYKHYFFMPNEMQKGEALLAQCTINANCYNWSREHFYGAYQAAWIPTHIPALILTSEYDYVFPADSFAKLDAYRRSNIQLAEIKNAGHFPWLNHAEAVKAAFAIFINTLKNS